MDFILQSPPSPLNFSLRPKHPWLSPPRLLAPLSAFVAILQRKNIILPKMDWSTGQSDPDISGHNRYIQRGVIHREKLTTHRVECS